MVMNVCLIDTIMQTSMVWFTVISFDSIHQYVTDRQTDTPLRVKTRIRRADADKKSYVVMLISQQSLFLAKNTRHG